MVFIVTADENFSHRSCISWQCRCIEHTILCNMQQHSAVMYAWFCVIARPDTQWWWWSIKLRGYWQLMPLMFSCHFFLVYLFSVVIFYASFCLASIFEFTARWRFNGCRHWRIYNFYSGSVPRVLPSSFLTFPPPISSSATFLLPFISRRCGYISPIKGPPVRHSQQQPAERTFAACFHRSVWSVTTTRKLTSAKRCRWPTCVHARLRAYR